MHSGSKQITCERAMRQNPPQPISSTPGFALGAIQRCHLHGATRLCENRLAMASPMKLKESSRNMGHPLRMAIKIYTFHQGISPLRKSCSVHGATAMFPSRIEACASASDKGAGPRTFMPLESY